MRLLLDTHALIWWWTDDRQLPASARKLIADKRNEIVVSAASAWEIATKQRLGKLRGVPTLTSRRHAALLAADGFVTLAITSAHALAAGSYPQAHGDPFDRILAAQSQIEDLPLVSKDRALRQFDVELLW